MQLRVKKFGKSRYISHFLPYCNDKINESNTMLWFYYLL